jgi:hypothetical protein
MTTLNKLRQAIKLLEEVQAEYNPEDVDGMPLECAIDDLLAMAADLQAAEDDCQGMTDAERQRDLTEAQQLTRDAIRRGH